MLNELARVWQRRELLLLLVRRDLEVRYKNSRLGFLWSIAPPLMQVVVITVVFTRATDLAKDFPSYSAYLLVAMIPWTFFNQAVLDSSQSILLMMGVIKKVDIPREIIPIANTLSNFIHFSLSWLVFFVYWWAIRRETFLPTTPLVLYLMLAQLMLVAGICLFVSCLNVFYEDVKYIVTILMQLFFFTLPIIFVVEMFQLNGSRGTWWRPYALAAYRLNPLTALITGYRKVLLEPPSAKALKGAPYLPLDYGSLVWVGVFSLATLVAGYWYFNRRKWQFVERP